MKVYVKTKEDFIYIVDIDKDKTIHDLKSKLQKEVKIPYEEIVLHFVINGKTDKSINYNDKIHSKFVLSDLGDMHFYDGKIAKRCYNKYVLFDIGVTSNSLFLLNNIYNF